jgi:hypothetical protein
MGEISWIVQSGQPGGYKQNQRQKQINSHVARFANGRRMKLAASLRKPKVVQCPQLQDVEENDTNDATKVECGNRENKGTFHTSPDALAVARRYSRSRPRYSPTVSILHQYGYSVFSECPQIDGLLHFLNWNIVTPSVDEVEPQSLRADAWSLSMSVFADEGRACASLSFVAYVMSIATGDASAAILATTLRIRSMKSLRRQLFKQGLNQDTAASIAALAIAEIGQGDAEAAAVHVRYLESHIQPESGLSYFGPPGAAHMLLWQVIHQATRTLTRPILDLDRWQDEYCPNLWWPNNPSFRRLLKSQYALDHEAVTDTWTLELLTEVRKYGVLLKVLTKTRALMPREDSLQLSTSLLLLNGRLLECYLEHVSPDSRSHAAAPLERFDRLQTAATVLAAIYWIRIVTRDDTIIPQSGYEAIDAQINSKFAILAHLKSHLHSTASVVEKLLADYRKSFDNDTPLCSTAIPPPLRLRLWLLHISAYIEWTFSGLAVASHQQAELEQFTSDIHLNDNQTVYHTILRGFLPIEENNTLGPTWFKPIFRCAALAHVEDGNALTSQSWEMQCLSRMQEMSHESLEGEHV